MISWQLQDQGLGVILPTGLTADSHEQRLGIKIAATVTPKKGERLSLTSLLNFQLKFGISVRIILHVLDINFVKNYILT